MDCEFAAYRFEYRLLRGHCKVTITAMYKQLCIRLHTAVGIAALIVACLVPSVCAQVRGSADPLQADLGYDLLELSELAEGGDSRAAYFIARRYATGDGVTRDLGEAVRWFKRAAQDDLPEAQHWLGMMYARGRGVEADLTRAAQWLKLAANQGLPQAQHALGTMMLKGKGIKRDDVEAAKWLQQAAAQGLPRAQYNLGVLYEFGRGVTVSVTRAKKWYRAAASAGFDAAAVRLRDMAALVAAMEQGKALPEPSKLPAESTKVTAQAIDAIDALAGLKDSDYTLQLVSYRSLKRAQSAVRKFKLGSEARIFSSRSRGRLWFVIIYGSFSDAVAAKAEIPKLHRALRKAKPRVRGVGAIRRELASQSG